MTDRDVSRDMELTLRQTRRIAPSNIDPWFGSWVGDAAMTQEQLRGIEEAGIAEADVETIDVRISTTDAQLWVPIGSKHPWRVITCPIVQRRSDGRVMVISPSGMSKLVFEEGYLRKPRPSRWERRP